MSELDYGAAIQAEERAADLLYRELGRGQDVEPDMIHALSAALEAAGNSARRLSSVEERRLRDRAYAAHIDDALGAVRRAFVPDVADDVLMRGADALADLDTIVDDLRHHRDRPELDL